MFLETTGGRAPKRLVSDQVNANGDAEGMPSGYPINALQGVTQRDLAMHADGSNGGFRGGKEGVIAAAPHPVPSFAVTRRWLSKNKWRDRY
jgi:hypothetical protein